MSEDIKRQWRSVAFNLASFLLNILIVTLSSDPWMWPANCLAAGISAYVAYWSWSKIKEIKQQEQARIIRILSGDFG